MPRIARAVLPGFPYHVTHRGNRRGATFLDEVERRRYLDLFLEVRSEAGLRVWAYCLMANHVHWIVVPERADSLADGVGRVHRRYSAWFNHRHGWSGHLWANRFFSTALDDRYLWFAARYVERNPLRAGMVRDPTEYPWSSARANALGESNPLLDPERPFARPQAEWADWLHGEDCSAQAAEHIVRANTCTGRPTGSGQFVQSMEAALGRTLVSRGRGRPSKDVAPAAVLPGPGGPQLK